jgi:uncharacterized membrane protein
MHTLSLFAVAAVFVGAGVAHFVWPPVFVRIVPPYVPRPLLLVYLSGVAEVLGGLGVLVPALRVYAGWGLLLLLCAVFPVHTYMARHPEVFSKVPGWALYGRIPLQFVLMAWVYWTACRAG